MDKDIERRIAVNVDDLKHSKNDEKIESSLYYNISLNSRTCIGNSTIIFERQVRN